MIHPSSCTSLFWWNILLLLPSIKAFSTTTALDASALKSERRVAKVLELQDIMDDMFAQQHAEIESIAQSLALISERQSQGFYAATEAAVSTMEASMDAALEELQSLLYRPPVNAFSSATDWNPTKRSKGSVKVYIPGFTTDGRLNLPVEDQPEVEESSSVLE